MPLLLIALLAACGEDGGGVDDELSSAPTLAYVRVTCRDDAETFVFGPEVLEIRRGNADPITVVEIPAAAPQRPAGLCHVFGLGRHGPGTLAASSAVTRVAVSPDGSAVVFEVTDEFSVSSHNLPAQLQQIFFVHADGSGLRSLGPASRSQPGGYQGFRFSSDGRTVVFDDRGRDRDGNGASQVVILDIATGERTQVTHLSPGPPGSLGSVCCPRFLDDETIVFSTTLDADGLHPEGGVFTVRTDGSDPRSVPLPVAQPDSRIDPTFTITGDQPAAATFVVPGTPVNAHYGFNDIREVFLVDGGNLLQLTNFHRVDTRHPLLDVGQQRVFFIASADPLGTNPTENCQLFSVGVTGTDLRQLTNFHEEESTYGCQSNLLGTPKPFGCLVTRLFQEPTTQSLAFFSSCDPLGTNPYGVQVFSMRPDGSTLRQLTNLRGVMTGAEGTFTAEMLGIFAYPGVGSSYQD